MGTGVSIDVPGLSEKNIIDQVFNRLHQIDAKFSTYKDSSEVSKYRRGELEDKDLSPELAAVIRACKHYEKLTDGYFSAWAGAPVSGLDTVRNEWFNPNGYVKGWAISEAGKLLKKNGYKTFCIGIGGDILAASDGSKQWKVGIQDPQNRSKILNKLSINSGAVATSGNYLRGQHIINPKTGQPANQILSLTVVGPDIIKADVLATAAFAMGATGLDFVDSRCDGYQAMLVDKRGKLQETRGFSYSQGRNR